MRDNGGSIFPVSERCEADREDSHGPVRLITEQPHGGLTLRDYFAGQALALVLSQDGSRIASKLAVNAYEIADAMLEARAK